MLYPYMSSAPFTLGRPSSPLNPNPTTSSSPPRDSSSTRFSSGSGGLSSPTPMSHKAKTRYKRPDVQSKRYLQSAPAELFAEGTTPTEGLMWRERFSRRMEDREKRRKSREAGIDKRRALVEEEDEAKAREDDEEIFRRLMIMQRKREQRASQISYELDNGGSDPISPDFWDEEEGNVPDWALEEEQEKEGMRAGPSNYQTPPRPRAHQSMGMEEEDQWAIEAARAEEAEREAEEAELARQVEESYNQSQGHPHQQVQQPIHRTHQQVYGHQYQQQGPNQHNQQHNHTPIPDDAMMTDDVEMDWDVDMDL